jgi:hypothetical protein
MRGASRPQLVPFSLGPGFAAQGPNCALLQKIKSNKVPAPALVGV